MASSGCTPSSGGISGKTAAPSGTSAADSSAMSTSGDGRDDGQLVAGRLRGGLKIGRALQIPAGVCPHLLRRGEGVVRLKNRFPGLAAEDAQGGDDGAGPTPDQTDDTPTPVDPLRDIATVLGQARRVLTRVVLTRLAELNPAEYEGWTFTDLKAALAVYGIEPVKSDGLMVIRAEDITTALTERDQDTDGSGDEETGS